MMRTILFLGLLLFGGCQQQAEDAPEHLLDRETFISVLAEAQLIEARVNHEMVVQQRREVPMHQYYEQVFAAHNTDREQFQRTFDHYAQRPVELKEIYEEVIAELTRRKDLPAEQEPLQGDTTAAEDQAG